MRESHWEARARQERRDARILAFVTWTLLAGFVVTGAISLHANLVALHVDGVSLWTLLLDGLLAFYGATFTQGGLLTVLAYTLFFLGAYPLANIARARRVRLTLTVLWYGCAVYFLGAVYLLLFYVNAERIPFRF